MELPPSREQKRTLFTLLPNEQLISIATQTISPRLLERLRTILQERYEIDDSLENFLALDYVASRKEFTQEIAALDASFNMPTSETIAAEEEINEALFKPYGE